jgi:hypothetical protein
MRCSHGFYDGITLWGIRARIAMKVVMKANQASLNRGGAIKQVPTVQFATEGEHARLHIEEVAATPLDLPKIEHKTRC